MDTLALILIAAGAINWGLVGFFQYDLIAALFGGHATMLSRIIYVAIGLAGIWSLTFFNRIERHNPTRIT